MVLGGCLAVRLLSVIAVALAWMLCVVVVVGCGGNNGGVLSLGCDRDARTVAALASCGELGSAVLDCISRMSEKSSGVSGEPGSVVLDCTSRMSEMSIGGSGELGAASSDCELWIFGAASSDCELWMFGTALVEMGGCSVATLLKLDGGWEVYATCRGFLALHARSFGGVFGVDGGVRDGLELASDGASRKIRATVCRTFVRVS